jgi:hypothetical protein
MAIFVDGVNIDGGSGGGGVPASPSISDMTGDGWDTVSAPGVVATWGGGKLAFVAASTATGIASVSNDELLPNTQAWDYAVRLDVAAGDAAAGGAVQFILRAGLDADNWISFTLYSDSRCEVLAKLGATVYTLLSAISFPDITDVIRTGAQLWMCISTRLLRFGMRWGVGVDGEPPTVWSRVYQTPDSVDANVLLAAQGTWASIIFFDVSGVTGGYSIDVLDIRTVVQEAGTLS